MRVLFCLNHPAHYHLCKNTIAKLKEDGNEVFILARQKDILLDLLKGEQYETLPYKKGKNIIDKIRFYAPSLNYAVEYAEKIKPDFVTGTGNFYMIPQKLWIPSWLLIEDDILTNLMIFIDSIFSTRKYTGILSPIVCNNSFLERKSIKYHSYHELAYLHPNNFTPDKTIVEKYFLSDKPFFILRFAQLNAYHDLGVSGINTDVAQHLIDMLKPYGSIYITSERPLEPQFERYRINIDPSDMHHVMAFASLYIGDSQTMAAESGVLGVPFVRFNDFVGKIGYLRELEDVYHLGYGLKPKDVDKLYKVVADLLQMPNRKEVFQQRRQKMLSEKIDYAQFLTWFIENYPESQKIMRENPNYQFRFK
jgi:predicted glycosyltransferase